MEHVTKNTILNKFNFYESFAHSFNYFGNFFPFSYPPPPSLLGICFVCLPVFLLFACFFCLSAYPSLYVAVLWIARHFFLQITANTNNANTISIMLPPPIPVLAGGRKLDAQRRLKRSHPCYLYEMVTQKSVRT